MNRRRFLSVVGTGITALLLPVRLIFPDQALANAEIMKLINTIRLRILTRWAFEEGHSLHIRFLRPDGGRTYVYGCVTNAMTWGSAHEGETIEAWEVVHFDEPDWRLRLIDRSPNDFFLPKMAA
jgi:hypothetical protein